LKEQRGKVVVVNFWPLVPTLPKGNARLETL